MAPQLVCDVVKRRPHVGYGVSHGGQQVRWDRPVDPEPVSPPVRPMEPEPVGAPVRGRLTFNRPDSCTLERIYALAHLVDMRLCPAKLGPPRRLRIFQPLPHDPSVSASSKGSPAA